MGAMEFIPDLSFPLPSMYTIMASGVCLVFLSPVCSSEVLMWSPSAEISMGWSVQRNANEGLEGAALRVFEGAFQGRLSGWT
ncbi:hypothetical protein BO70DRAFT_363562 [Aspergillus heteromorphus CBS 117.55]|uniref:Uncharacterized protein n=1 Tax=Aspergillus heteromorphus CBS 117.55 TaxID=1448321 RepID=A0A317VUL0_9EURO|nr:uncharacterized protein BO70DRAFT_363562 [Aspergillus heteromorphus CBS 117.55]PWY77021.1 hypothetical protein BO70DRAFT_363562 [Aspergillus heteromorphus CBS 117.55]